MVTQYSFGNLDLLKGPRIAFVAPQGFWASDLKPRLLWRRNGVAVSKCGASVSPPLISTFIMSAQEREALRRAIAKGLPVIQLIPQIPRESELPRDLLAACRNGRALLLSPQPTGSHLNKKVATWCNEYVQRHADEI